jgi:hypothetical protein
MDDLDINNGSFDQVKTLEEEQELLNGSLMALTAHFAQVQFRLRQIVDAPTEDKQVRVRYQTGRSLLVTSNS